MINEPYEHAKTVKSCGNVTYYSLTAYSVLMFHTETIINVWKLVSAIQ